MITRGAVILKPNQAINVGQVGGTAVDTNSGVKSAGTQRVVLATDQPALTNALKVDGTATIQPVSGTFFQGTQPVSLATNTPDVTDRAARLLGVVSGTISSVQSLPNNMPDTVLDIYSELILRELRRITLILVQGFGVDIPTDNDLEEGFAQ